MGKKDNSDRKETGISKEALAKVEEALDRLAAKVASLERSLVSERSAVLKEIAGLEAAQESANSSPKTATRRKAPATAKAKGPAGTRTRTAAGRPGSGRDGNARGG